MQLGKILIARGICAQADIDRALERQKMEGGLLGDSLIALGVVSESQLEALLNSKPKAPRSIEATGLSTAQLLKLLTKAMFAVDLQTPSELRDFIMLPASLIMRLLDEATQQKLVSAQGSGGAGSNEMSYALSEAGRRFAADAYEHNQYIGPVPVPLQDYQARIVDQKITNERVDQKMIEEAFSDLIVTDQFIDNIGPGINAGKCILLYGPPGNGKTSMAERIGGIFENTIYVPHAVDIEGSVMKVFDPSIHEPMAATTDVGKPSAIRDDSDKRWVPCKRPFVMVGGELTLSMLDLEFNAVSKFYEAPIHLKALGGTFLIDDFGRQFVSPTDLLNRWIVPLESRVDFMKLHSGKTFSVPFDELVIFATNMSPGELMDPAFLRRIPYKLKTIAPTADVFRQIFERVSEARGLTLTDEVFDFVLEELQNNYQMELAGYQPRFIADHVVNACKFRGESAAYSVKEAEVGLSHLYVRDGHKLKNLAA